MKFIFFAVYGCLWMGSALASEGGQNCEQNLSRGFAKLKSSCPNGVTFSIAAGAGGGTDALIRELGAHFSKNQVTNMVESNGAANGYTLTKSMASNTDPCKVLVASNGNIALNYLNPKYKPPIDIQNTFEPVSLVSTSPFVLAVNKNNEKGYKVSTAKEFFQAVQTKSLDFVTSGVGSFSHLIASEVEASLDRDFKSHPDKIDLNIPSKSSAEAMRDFTGGRAQYFVESPMTIGGAAKARPEDIVILGSTSDKVIKVNGKPVQPLSSLDPKLSTLIVKPFVGILTTKGKGSQLKDTFESVVSCLTPMESFSKKFGDMGYSMGDGTSASLLNLLKDYSKGGRFDKMLQQANNMQKLFNDHLGSPSLGSKPAGSGAP